MTEYFDGAAENLSIWYKSLMPDYRVIPSDDLPEGVLYGVKYSSLAINPSSVLPWLKEKLVAKGVSFVRAEVKSFDEARKITKARLIIHASGVSASKLAADKNALPVRGQTMFVKSDFNELVMREGSDYTYVIPRPGSGGVILGGIKSDRLDTAVDVALKGDILKRVNEITNGAFKDIDLDSVKDIVAFRPGRTGGIRVEREGNVVHAYGAGGAGYIYSFGVAERVRKLIEDERNVSKL
jgi:glycine/D-amino acid oxidase-like deaminating enzyme